MKRPSRLALRIYLIGLAQVVALGLALGLTAPQRPRRPPLDADATLHEPPPKPSVEGAALGVGMVLVLVGLSAVLTAAWLARPLQRLAEAARSFGEGKLSARAEFRRGDELGDLALAFDEMAGRIQALVRAQRELLANVSHELRTPLARIRVALDLAAETGNAADAESMQGIAGDLAEIERLIDDILISARLEISEETAHALTPLRPELFGVRLLFADAAARFHGKYPARILEVTNAAIEGLVFADRMLLRRALDNLLDNAARYSSSEHTGRADHPISLSSRVAENRVVIEVRDRGCGIEPDDLPRLFSPFFRADKSRARSTGGLGLGLLLTRRIIEAHRGTIAVDSSVGQGTCVRISLPLRAA